MKKYIVNDRNSEHFGNIYPLIKRIDDAGVTKKLLDLGGGGRRAFFYFQVEEYNEQEALPDDFPETITMSRDDLKAVIKEAIHEYNTAREQEILPVEVRTNWRESPLPVLDKNCPL